MCPAGLASFFPATHVPFARMTLSNVRSSGPLARSLRSHGQSPLSSMAIKQPIDRDSMHTFKSIKPTTCKFTIQDKFNLLSWSHICTCLLNRNDAITYTSSKRVHNRSFNLDLTVKYLPKSFTPESGVHT